MEKNDDKKKMKKFQVSLKYDSYEKLKEIADYNKKSVVKQVEYWIEQQIAKESKKTSIDTEKAKVSANTTTLNQSGGTNAVNAK